LSQSEVDVTPGIWTSTGILFYVDFAPQSF
jgi:hypothetical protein